MTGPSPETLHRLAEAKLGRQSPDEEQWRVEMLKMCLVHQGWQYVLITCQKGDNPTLTSTYIGHAAKGEMSTMLFTKGSESDLLICCVTAAAALDEQKRDQVAKES